MKVTEFINGTITYDKDGGYFWNKSSDNSLQMIAEIRGWGAIQNLFKNKAGEINMSVAADFQDEIGMWIAEALNAKLKEESEQLKISCNPSVMGSAICDAIDVHQKQPINRNVGMFLEIEKVIKLHLP